MAATSKNYTAIADATIDADSPLTETLVTYLRDNDVNAYERIGIATGAGQNVANHAHQGLGVDGSVVVSVGAGIYFDVTGGAVAKVAAGTATSYTNVDISGNTPSGTAKHAILVIRILNSSDTTKTFYLRKDGSATDEQAYEFSEWRSIGGGTMSFQCIVPLASEIFEYKLSGTSCSVDIDLVGYIV